MNREFTGRNMVAIMVGGFGIVVAVNLLMATYAVNGFGGVIVENSYVASQKFNGWLDEAEKARALGWEAELSRDAAGHLVVATSDVPEGAKISADLRRPLGERETARVDFAQQADGTYRSTAPVSAGRWTARLYITADGSEWASEVVL